ncbi:MAG TPA: hypothetical protein VGE95_16885 [Arthrobacter sp.]
MQLIIDTQRDSYEQALAAVQAAYGRTPVSPSAGAPSGPEPVARPDVGGLGGANLWEGWTERLLFQTLAAVIPGARTVLRRLVELGGTAAYDDIRQYFATHPETPIPAGRIVGALASVRAVRRRIGPDNKTNVVELDERVRIYRIEPALLAGLKQAFTLADARPDLLRQSAARL